MNTNRRLWLLVLVLAVSTAVFGGITIADFAGQRDDAQQTAEVTAGAAVPLADQVLNACKAGGEAEKALRERGLCIQADDTKDTIDKADVDPTPAPTKYLPPDPARLAALVRQYVFQFCGSDGSCQGKNATKGQVLEAVQQLIDAAVLRACGGSCVSTVPGPQGGSGADGADGEPGVGLTGEARCDAQGRFVFGLTNGSEAVVDGSRCRQAGVLPE